MLGLGGWVGGWVGYCKPTLSNNKNVLYNLHHPDFMRPPAVCEKTFPASFMPHPAENNTCFKHLFTYSVKYYTKRFFTQLVLLCCDNQYDDLIWHAHCIYCCNFSPRVLRLDIQAGLFLVCSGCCQSANLRATTTSVKILFMCVYHILEYIDIEGTRFSSEISPTRTDLTSWLSW